MKNNKNSKKVTKSTNTKTSNYKKVSKGVYVISSGNYQVRKMVNGKKICSTFTNKNRAISYYNSL